MYIFFHANHVIRTTMTCAVIKVKIKKIVLTPFNVPFNVSA